ncbi:MAG: DNA replication/repair protein RecF [Steroidobacteraceae bacterium]
MALTSLSVSNLRSIESAELAFGPHSNLISGPNGAGKTSLLEAIFLLGRGRSFRTRHNERLIQHGAATLRVVGHTDGGTAGHVIGIEVQRAGTTRVRADGQDQRSLAQLATTFPVQVLDPDVHELIEDAPVHRRRWLDWAVFHVEPTFGRAWSRYSRALQQRNAALRSGAAFQLWDPELVKEGEAMTVSRARVLEALQPYWRVVCADLVGLELTLGFQAGWDQERSLAEALAATAERDREREGTQIGPHRADVGLRLRGRLAREILSRGQQKLAAVAMMLAQLEYLQAEHGVRPTLLIDDPGAELDRERLGRLIERLRRLQTQLIVTALDPDPSLFGVPEAAFHVEQGRVTRI